MLGIIVLIALVALCFIIGMIMIKAFGMIIVGKWYKTILYPIGIGFGVLVVFIGLLVCIFKGLIIIMADIINLIICLLPFAAVVGIVVLLIKIAKK
jgi:hypothetical protein